MNLDDTITALLDSTSTRPVLVAALKAADAYTGFSRAGMADLKAHAAIVAAALIAADEADAAAELAAMVKPEPTPEPTPEPVAVKVAKPSESVAQNKARKARPGTIAKMAQAIASATADEQGVIVLTPEDYALAGMGSTWVGLSNRLFSTPGTMQHSLFTGLGFTAVNIKRTTVLTPITEQAVEVAS